MNTRSLIALAVLFAAGMRASPAAQDPAPSAPAVEQLALVVYGPCTGANPGTLHLASLRCLQDLDGSHAMAMPLGEWSPDGRQLLLNWSGEIHVTSATGGTSVNLTNHPANDSAPRWSRDGARIAFTSNRDGARDLYVMNADGSDVLRLNTGVADRVSPGVVPRRHAGGLQLRRRSARAGELRHLRDQHRRDVVCAAHQWSRIRVPAGLVAGWQPDHLYRRDGRRTPRDDRSGGRRPHGGESHLACGASTLVSGWDAFRLRQLLLARGRRDGADQVRHDHER